MELKTWYCARSGQIRPLQARLLPDDRIDIGGIIVPVRDSSYGNYYEDEQEAGRDAITQAVQQLERHRDTLEALERQLAQLRERYPERAQAPLVEGLTFCASTSGASAMRPPSAAGKGVEPTEQGAGGVLEQRPNVTDARSMHVRALVTEAIAQKGERAAKSYAKMSASERKLCLEWIAAATDEDWMAERAHSLADNLPPFYSAYYSVGEWTFGELRRRYGPPRPLAGLPPEEQALALQEGRVVEMHYTRQHDDCRVWFTIPQEDTPGRCGSTFSYARPCRITAAVSAFLDYNGWDNIREAEEALLD